jgi:hypothetical protein
MPWGFTLALNSSFISRTPVTPVITNPFLQGTVPAGSTVPLPGIAYGSLAAGSGKSDLQAAVDNYNTKIVGTTNTQGSPISTQFALPSNYQFGDPTISQDFRLTKVFTFKERLKISVLAEMFNAFNIANLTGYSFQLDAKAANPATQTFAFGQPTQRANQTFGSGGPRAVQLGARITF